MVIENNFSLKQFNTFGLDVKCKYFAEINQVGDLSQLIEDRRFKNETNLPLGGGSNVLFTNNYDGLVIKNSIKGIELIHETDTNVFIKANAGEIWHELIIHCIENNWAGIENLSLIPGQVGAAPMQNIGAYGVELQTVFKQLEAFDLQSGELVTFNKADCKFGYRESVFKRLLKGQFMIASVTLKLNKKPQFNISYGAIQQTLENTGITDLSIKAISDAVIKIRSNKLPDPKKIGNAGSFFKNPEISQITFNTFIEQHPSAPNYPTVNGVKIPAGWLIEQCGWKGKRVGNTGSHKDQALVLVNYGKAEGREIVALAESIQQSVEDKFGIKIIPEVNVI